MEREEADQAIQKIDLWFDENSPWLTEWLTNVIMIPEQEMNTLGKIFQSFSFSLPNPDIKNILSVSNQLKYALLRHTVFGKERKTSLIHPHNAGIRRSDCSPTLPSMFSGFIESVKRFPKEGDIALYTACEWFSVFPAVGQLFFLRTICTVDFIVPYPHSNI